MDGLTEAEARARRDAEGGGSRASGGRTYWSIARTNLFTFFNNILFTIGVALVALGRISDAIASVGLGLVNAVIGVAQEARAKRKLDRIALLTRPTVTVVRDGQRKQVDAAALVRGDLVVVQAGDQLTADGTVVGSGQLEMDESLLTGEADLVPKRAGDRLLSGSFCVAGEACFEAERVGEDSFASRLTRTAREFRVVKTPLQRRIDVAVRLVTLVVALMSLAILLQALLENLPLTRIVQISAVLSGQVPYGLFFMAAVAYSLGAAALAREGGLVQQVNAIESLSNVDVLCMDKTGTLTANRLRLHAVTTLGELDEATVRLRLGEFAKSTSEANGTSLALADALPGEARAVADEIPFASARKWSALAFEDDPGRGVWALGAIETLGLHLPAEALDPEGALSRQVAAWSRAGLRVLVLAHSAAANRLHDDAGEALLPPLAPVAVVALGDELRDEAVETIAKFRELGIRAKVISGDNPETVSALARQAGVPAAERFIAGPELAQMSAADFDRAAVETTVFGRVTPDQKERLVDALMRQGHYVAMMGDGVNDALSLKRAKLGIAVESASNVTRNVADMVLLGDSFGALRPAFTRGRRIVNALASSMYLFLTRVVTSTLLIVAIAIVGLGFPYEPAQISLTLFTVGIPSLCLTLWARPETPDPQLLRSLARFVFPAAIVTAIAGVAVYTMSYEIISEAIKTSNQFPAQALRVYEDYTGLAYQRGGRFEVAAATIEAQTMLSIFVSLTAFVLILFLEPPFRLFTAWRPRSPDRRPALLALGLFVVFMAVTHIPAIANYFALIVIGPTQHFVLAAALIAWFLALSAVWRWRLLDRLFSLEDLESPPVPRAEVVPSASGA